MASFILDIGGAPGATAVSNIFIDTYMPRASGSFVKVYLCLLRHVQFPGAAVTLSSVADMLEETEKDIVRALNYWEKEGLMLLNRDADGAITGIRFLTPGYPGPAPGNPGVAPGNSGIAPGNPDADGYQDSPAVKPSGSPSSVPDFAADIAAADDAGDSEGGSGTGPRAKAAVNAATLPARQDFLPGLLPEPSEDPDSVPEHFEKPDYTEAQIEQMKENEEVKWMLTVIEVYLERLLKPMDVQLILYLYESLGFPAELILYLYEYCVSRNKKSPSYVEAVALAWAREGIDTVEKAEAASSVYTSGFQTVNKAFGLNRAPGSAERQYIQKWFGSMKFEARIIEEACSRALLQTGRPDFKYADKILENWKKEGVTSFTDIAACDERHAKEMTARKASAPQKDAPVRPSLNKFNAYPQRSYSGEEFTSMEQRLLSQHLQPKNGGADGDGR